MKQPILEFFAETTWSGPKLWTLLKRIVSNRSSQESYPLVLPFTLITGKRTPEYYRRICPSSR